MSTEMDRSPSALADRRARLALVCELDRLHLKLAVKKTQGQELEIAGLPVTTVTKAFSLAQLFPGPIGRWSRRLSLGAELLRAFNPLARR